MSIPFTDIKILIKNYTDDLWQNEWNTSNTFMKGHTPDIKPKIKTSRNRITQSKINRIVIGHTPLTHEYLITNSNKPRCQHCNDILTIEHIFKCPNLENQRMRQFIKQDIKDNFSSQIKIEKIMKYLKDTNFYEKI